jgi:hypothetical protein
MIRDYRNVERMEFGQSFNIGANLLASGVCSKVFYLQPKSVHIDPTKPFDDTLASDRIAKHLHRDCKRIENGNI